MSPEPHSLDALPIRRVTTGTRAHFFGYYEKTPWDLSGRYLLALEADYTGRRPSPDDTAIVGMIDLDDNDRWIPLAETHAWNWQQGAMLQWRPGSHDEILYNDRRDGRFVGIARHVHTGAERVLSRPVYGVSPNGREAISLNFSRLAEMHPACGYAGIPDPWTDQNSPSYDGAYHLDLETGESRLTFSLADAVELGQTATGKHWLNHVQFNTDGTRFGVLHRWRVGERGWGTRLLTLSPEGKEPYILSDHEMVSHYDWRDAQTVLAWARRPATGDRYYLLTDKTQNADIVGDGVLTVDGHCSYSPDRRWILTDTYPDSSGYRTLLLFDTHTNKRLDLQRFYGPSTPDVELRCDLHPRWNRDGRLVCIDSLHENGDRQVYVLDVAAITTP